MKFFWLFREFDCYIDICANIFLKDNKVNFNLYKFFNLKDFCDNFDELIFCR